MAKAILITIASLLLLAGIFLLLHRAVKKKGRDLRAGARVGAYLGYGILAALILFCAVTYAFTPLFMVHENFNSAAYESLMHTYQEQSEAIETPELQLSPFSLDSSCGTLTGWMITSPENDGSHLLLYLGGISNDASGSTGMFLQILSSTDTYDGWDIAVLDYPGYGKSGGHATDQSLRQSAVCFYDEMQAETGAECIVLMGYSMGTGPAVYAASLRRPAGLILISPYASAVDLYNAQTPVFYGPLAWLLSYRMDTASYAESVAVSPLIAACTTDTRVPYESSCELAAHFPLGAEFVTVAGVSHGDMPSDPDVLRAVRQYLEEKMQQRNTA